MLIDDDLVESIEGFIVSIVEIPGMFHVNPGPNLFVDIIDDESKYKILYLPYICVRMNIPHHFGSIL